LQGDVKEYGLEKPAGDEVYGIFRDGFVNRLVVRTALDPDRMAAVIRAALHEVDPLMAVESVETVERAEYDSMASPRLMSLLLGIFAGLAVVISCSGIAAVMALAVSQRTREIGIRMALGAEPRDVLSLVLRQGIFLVIGGVLAGLLGAIALTRVLSRFLLLASATDPLTFAAVTLLLAAIALAACYVPARRAMRVDPMVALRHE